MSATTNASLTPQVLALLRCPLTRSPLRHDGDELIAEVGGLRYAIRDGIPVLLVEEAELPEGVDSLDALREKLKAEGVEVFA
jgi:uncharacterized protein YbaR (Trm112 family)